ERDDAHGPPARHDRQAADRVLAHEAHRRPDLVVRRDGGELAAADVDECGRLRVATVGDPAHHDVTIGHDAQHLVAVDHDDVPDAHVTHRLGGVDQRRAQRQGDGIGSHHVLYGLVFGHAHSSLVFDLVLLLVFLTVLVVLDLGGKEQLDVAL